MSTPSLVELRRYAIARTFFTPLTLEKAVRRLGYVQADPIRAPARAQDLILRHRVRGYRAGDLERRYPKLAIEEDHFVNYGFLPREHAELLHPRTPRRPWDAATTRRAASVLDFIRENGPTHPREVEARFAHGRVTNYWGGTSNASTHLLDGMHYRGLLRVCRRERGIRVYEAATRLPSDDSPASRAARARALLELVVRKYAPLPAPSLGYLTTLLTSGAPQLRSDLREALRSSPAALSTVTIDGVQWFFPSDEAPADPSECRPAQAECEVRLLAPFDPLVWDRRRFELFFGWTYKFEAYTPPAQRKLGYYALPLLFREQVIGWGNVTAGSGQELDVQLGYVRGSAPRDKAFRSGLDAELERLRSFLSRE